MKSIKPKGFRQIINITGSLLTVKPKRPKQSTESKEHVNRA